MTAGSQDWAALARLTGTTFDAAQARMALFRQRELALRATMAALESDRKTRAEAAIAGDPAQRAGADVLWQQWVDRRRAALNMELARTLAQIEAARSTLARAHGRHQVTASLAKDATKTARDRRERRLEQGW